MTFPHSVGPGGSHQAETPDSTLSIEQIEEKLIDIARDLQTWPDWRRTCSLHRHWESGVLMDPTPYDLKHLHLNRLLDLREMRLFGAIVGEAME